MGKLIQANFANLLGVFCLSVSAIVLTACSDVRLESNQANSTSVKGYVNVDATVCTSGRFFGKEKVKYLFILDHSSSNQAGFPLTASDVTSTDPAGARRYGTLAYFISQLNPPANVDNSFSVIDFSDKASQPVGMTGFISDAPTFLKLVNTDWRGTGTDLNPVPNDGGFTDYLAALKMANDLIVSDAKQEALLTFGTPVAVSYHIIFVSDGEPVINEIHAGALLTKQDFDTEIKPAIDTILAIKHQPPFIKVISNIELNTGYYFADKSLPDAIKILAQMAAEGGGQALQFSGNNKIDYSQFGVPVQNIRRVLDDIFIDNENAVWWDDGQLLRDSSGSGLPDKIKSPLGADITKADSDGNGVSDLVEFRTKLQPCADKSCSSTGRYPFGICQGLISSISASGVVQYTVSSGSGFNDCEATILGLDKNKFSTNGTLIPDLLAYKNSLPVAKGSDGTQNDPFGDGITNYQKLKLGMPLTASSRKLTNFIPRATSLEKIQSSDPSLDCYHLSVKNIATIGSKNKIRVYVVESGAVLGQGESVRSASQTALNDGVTLKFQTVDFQ